MASTTAVSLQTLIDETLALLYRASERPAQLLVGTTPLASGIDQSVTFTGDANIITNLQCPALVEMGQEQILLTAKSADATPVFSCFRGYNASPAAAHATGTVALIGPLWTRFDVRRQILRSLQGTISTQLPAVKNTTATPTANQYWVAAPADATNIRRVAVKNFTPLAGISINQWIDFNNWTFEDDVDTSLASTGRLITIPPSLSCNTTTPPTLYITYEAAYAWSGGNPESPTSPAETETVNLPQGAEDLPCLYAAAYLASGREVTRLQMDKVEEWTNQAGTDQRVSGNARVIQMMWQEFYRRLDEARRLQIVPKHRAYRPMRRFF